MRNAIFVLFLASCGAGCGDEPVVNSQPDLATNQLPVCPGNVDVNPPNQVSCPTVGALCVNQGPGSARPTCQCLCTHKWECDQVKVVCDPDMGPPQD